MRIVHVSLRYPPGSGGAENYARDIVETTRDVEAKRDVRVLTSRLRTHAPVSELSPLSLREDPVYVQRLQHANTPTLAYPRLQSLPYYLAHHKPDVIHGYGFWYQPADSAARYAAGHGIPFIFHPLYYRNSVRKKIVWQLYARTIGRRTFSRADAVVVISPFEQSLIERDGFPVRRFALIPPGIDMQQLRAGQLNPFSAHNITGRVIMTAGRLASGKGLEDAITAFAMIAFDYPDVQLVIIGEDFGAKRTLRRLAKEKGLADRIHFLGKLDRAELIGAYQHAYVFAHPSHYEAFGIVLAESLACHTPVIARNVAAIPYIVADQVTGLLWKTPEEFSRALRALLDNPAMREKMGQAGYDYVKNNFSLDALKNRVLHLYEELGFK